MIIKLGVISILLQPWTWRKHANCLTFIIQWKMVLNQESFDSWLKLPVSLQRCINLCLLSNVLKKNQLNLKVGRPLYLSCQPNFRTTGSNGRVRVFQSLIVSAVSSSSTFHCSIQEMVRQTTYFWISDQTFKIIYVIQVEHTFVRIKSCCLSSWRAKQIWKPLLSFIFFQNILEDILVRSL